MTSVRNGEEIHTPSLATEDTPDFPRIYSYKFKTSELYYVSLADKARGSVELVRQIHIETVWVELPDHSLFCTGGEKFFSPTREAWQIQVARDFSVIDKPPILKERSQHCSAYYRGNVYVISGNKTVRCERFSLDREQWTEIPCIPHGVCWATAVLLEKSQSIFVLGGLRLNLIQEYNIDRRAWLVLPAFLSPPTAFMPSFSYRGSVDAVFFICGNLLCNLEHNQIVVRKLLPFDCYSRNGVSYYYKGDLYCSSNEGYPAIYPIGELHDARPY
mmetsp:Transcript_3693/g.7901  ORF Transcript_3693/g.7901 Transcript_3693/m.7901 type:complete len:273 (-) Transcript_3693:926-1744(-)